MPPLRCLWPQVSLSTSSEPPLRCLPWSVVARPALWVWDLCSHMGPCACFNALFSPSWSLYQVLSRDLSFSFSSGSCRSCRMFLLSHLVPCPVLDWAPGPITGPLGATHVQNSGGSPAGAGSSLGSPGLGSQGHKRVCSRAWHVELFSVETFCFGILTLECVDLGYLLLWNWPYIFCILGDFKEKKSILIAPVKAVEPCNWYKSPTLHLGL